MFLEAIFQLRVTLHQPSQGLPQYSYRCLILIRLYFYFDVIYKRMAFFVTYKQHTLIHYLVLEKISQGLVLVVDCKSACVGDSVVILVGNLDLIFAIKFIVHYFFLFTNKKFTFQINNKKLKN